MTDAAPRRAPKTEKILILELRGKAEGFPAVSGTDVTGGSCPGIPVPILIAPFLSRYPT
jgi:hypothetical protein